MQVTTRSPLREAQERAHAAGQHTFTINLPCPHGHLSPRYASNGNCTQCAAQFRGNRKPLAERQLKLPNGNGRVTQVSQDDDTLTLTTYAKKKLKEVMGRPVSISVIHKAGIVLLAQHLHGTPSTASINSLIRHSKEQH